MSIIRIDWKLGGRHKATDFYDTENEADMIRLREDKARTGEVATATWYEEVYPSMADAAMERNPLP